MASHTFASHTFDRRKFLATSLIAGGVAASPALALTSALATPGTGEAAAPTRQFPTRQFEVTTTVTLPPAAGPAHLWLPVFHSDKAYQHRLAADWQTNATAHLQRDAQYGAQLLAAHWPDTAQTPAAQPPAAQPPTASEPRQLTLTQHIATWDRTPVPHAHLSTEDRQRFTAATAHLPTDGLVRDTARRILAAAGNPAEPKAQARALYDWVVANSYRDAATPGCGAGDVSAMLASGKLGGKCVDISGLMVSLSRSVGIPARDVYGLRLAPSALFHALGRGGDVTGAQHCRAEVWLEGTGWFAVDPADVRKAVLEEKLPVDSAPIRALTERLFGAWESNWAGYNSASGIVLPGADQPLRYDFLMYPAAINGADICNCLDAAHFTYHITSRELTA